MLLSPFPFGIGLGCALTTSVPVVLTLDQQGDEEHNGAQCACLLSLERILCYTQMKNFHMVWRWCDGIFPFSSFTFHAQY